MQKNKIIGIIGPTASGKTKYAVELAAQLDAEIISMDSRQVYRGLNIGTGKDLEEYTFGDKVIPHHLIDIVDINDTYHVHQFKIDFEKACKDILSRGKQIIACGGTGLYFDVLLNSRPFTGIPIDETLRAELLAQPHEDLINTISSLNTQGLKFDTSTKKRSIRAIEVLKYLAHSPMPIEEEQHYDWELIGIKIDKVERNKRIDQRLMKRVEEGLFEEVEMLLNKGISTERLVYFGLEYKFIAEYFAGKYTKEEVIEKLKIAIHQFAKRQMTFFRKLEKENHFIKWQNLNSKF